MGVWGAVWIGAVAGASTLIRPIALFFVVPSALYLLFARKRRRVACAVAFALAFAVATAAWATRNYRATGYFSVSSISGLTMVLRGAGALAIDDPAPFADSFLARRRQLEAEAWDDIRRAQQVDCEIVSVAKKAEYQAKRGRSAIAEHPTAYARVVSKGVGAILFGGDAVDFEQLAGRWTRPVLIVYGGLTLGLAVLGCRKLWGHHRAFCALALLTIVYFVLVSAGPEAYSRHRVPIVPLYSVLIGAGVGALLRRVRAV